MMQEGKMCSFFSLLNQVDLLPSCETVSNTEIDIEARTIGVLVIVEFQQ